MDAKIKFMFKDALILTVITLVSGFLLAFVYQMTKEPIEVQDYKKKMEAYKNVYQVADKFESTDKTIKMYEESNGKLSDGKLGKVGIEEILEAKDKSGKSIGYVVTAYSDEGYGGRIRISLGYDVQNKKVTKIEILEASETAGLGAKISNPDFKNQFNDKKVEKFTVVKTKAENDSQIQAISGATISSSAVTNAVDAAILSIGGKNE